MGHQPYQSIPTAANPTINNFDGTLGGLQDSQLHPTFVKPYLANVFTVQQTFRWSCPYYNNGDWNTFVNYDIVRYVQQHTPPLQGWYYQVTKAGYTAQVDPLP